MFNREGLVRENCWGDLPLGFKFYLLVSVGMIVPSMMGLFDILRNQILVEDLSGFQLHRFVFAFLVIPGREGLVSMLINFYMLLSCWPPLEHKYSTVYILIEILSLNLLIQTVWFVLATLTLILFSRVLEVGAFFNFGWFPITMVFLWKYLMADPQAMTSLCCLPLMIKSSHIAWGFLALCLVMSPSVVVVADVTGWLIGYTQENLLHNNIIRLPCSFYQWVQRRMCPAFIKDRPDFVQIQGEVLKELTRLSPCQCSRQDQAHQSNNPIQGRGVLIGSTFQHSNQSDLPSQFNEWDHDNHLATSRNIFQSDHH